MGGRESSVGFAGGGVRGGILAYVGSFFFKEGFNLLLALNQLNIGLALEAGLCISLIAILLDKMSLAWANKQID